MTFVLPPCLIPSCTLWKAVCCVFWSGVARLSALKSPFQWISVKRSCSRYVTVTLHPWNGFSASSVSSFRSHCVKACPLPSCRVLLPFSNLQPRGFLFLRSKVSSSPPDPQFPFSPILLSSYPRSEGTGSGTTFTNPSTPRNGTTPNIFSCLFSKTAKPIPLRASSSYSIP